MEPVRLVRFVTLSDAFEAKVLAARLGANGVLCQIRGGGVDPTYPLGTVELLVAEDDVDVARELMLADEVEASFDDETSRPSHRGMAVLAIVALLVAFAILRIVGALVGS